MLSLPEIRERLRDRRVRRVAEATGVHHQTIYNVLDPSSNPQHSTLKALSDYLTGAEA